MAFVRDIALWSELAPMTYQ